MNYLHSKPKIRGRQLRSSNRIKLELFYSHFDTPFHDLSLKN